LANGSTIGEPKCLTVASQTGQLQVVDLMNPNAINLRQANVSFMLGIDLSPSGEALAINDAECAIQSYSEAFLETNPE
jgi:hypothetical protein